MAKCTERNMQSDLDKMFCPLLIYNHPTLAIEMEKVKKSGSWKL